MHHTFSLVVAAVVALIACSGLGEANAKPGDITGRTLSEPVPIGGTTDTRVRIARSR
jgi:hypothetical protein